MKKAKHQIKLLPTSDIKFGLRGSNLAELANNWFLNQRVMAAKANEFFKSCSVFCADHDVERPKNNKATEVVAKLLLKIEKGHSLP